TSTGSEAADILSEVDAGGGDLDKALSGVERIKTGTPGTTGGTGSSTGTGTGGRDVKGSRSSNSEGIGGVISGRGTAKSKDMDRQGGFVVSAVSEVANEDGYKNQSRNPDEVSAVINNHNSAIQYCYQRELKRNPELRGKIVIRFTIAPNGRVTEAKILSSTVNNQRVERCVVNRVRRWDDFGAIDSSKGDAVFRQVYTFGY
ncbi:MAG: AgmX/PglI C-terminal domain-containing protein, partial [candidate division KSB1 bacterium]|nr:AgmX/PglI C-terminal domain-containing protein [candidate division KSB1 bacterium]